MRRLKADVLPQLPRKRQVVVPVALGNEREYRLAEKDVIAWLREQPLDLSELDRRVAAALRAERLAQLNALKRLAARGKLGAALGWIEDFLASDEPLVVFAGHREVQDLLVERFPDAAHLLGRDSGQAREAAVQAFQDPDGPQLILCSTRVGAQGITLTRASNVAFLDLEWTPAIHDQAEDRCHRIGQEDAVTAWYLLAADTIDETMIELIAPQARDRRRGHRRPPRRVRGARPGRRARAARLRSPGGGCARWRSRYGPCVSENASPAGERVRAAEVIAALSLATDLATGLPLEHGLESTLAAMRLSERLGVDAETAQQTYYACLLFYVGCTADARGRGGPLRRVGAGDAPGAGHVRVAARVRARHPARARAAGGAGAGAGAGGRPQAAARGRGVPAPRRGGLRGRPDADRPARPAARHPGAVRRLHRALGRQGRARPARAARRSRSPCGSCTSPATPPSSA